jgi:hypothetical protein
LPTLKVLKVFPKFLLLQLFCFISPMESFDWVAVTTTDFVNKIYTALDMPLDEESEITAAQEAEKTVSRSLSHSLLSSKLKEKVGSISKDFSDALITPMKQRVMQQHMFHGVYSTESLRGVIQSVRDLQGLVLYELSKITSIYRSKQSLLEPVRLIQPVGITVSKSPDFDIALEVLVVRVSSLLDDILASDEVFKYFHASESSAGVVPSSHRMSVPASPMKCRVESSGLTSRLSPFKGSRNVRMSEDNGVDSFEVSISVIETQETLVFSLLRLLRSMAYDSAKVFVLI